MSLSTKESEKLRKIINSVKKRLIRQQNNEPHSAASTRIFESSDPSRIPIPVADAGSSQNSENTSIKGRKRKKNSRLENAIKNQIDGLQPQQDLETPSKSRKLVRKQLTFSTGLKTTYDQMSKNQRKRKKAAENQVKNNSGLSPEDLEMLQPPNKRKKLVQK